MFILGNSRCEQDEEFDLVDLEFLQSARMEAGGGTEDFIVSPINYKGRANFKFLGRRRVYSFQ